MNDDNFESLSDWLTHKTVNIAESDLMEDYLDIIESGLNSFEYVDECKNQVTVTVTTTVSQCQAK